MPVQRGNCCPSEGKIGDRFVVVHYLSKNYFLRGLGVPFKSYWSLSFPESNTNHLPDPISFLSTITRRMRQGPSVQVSELLPQRVLYTFLSETSQIKSQDIASVLTEFIHLPMQVIYQWEAQPDNHKLH